MGLAEKRVVLAEILFIRMLDSAQKGHYVSPPP
jgi:hypothetical protein